MTPQEIEQFKTWGAPLPTREAHGTDADVQSQMVRATPRNWRQEGNQLMADTELGTLVHMLPTDTILTGTDADGNPTFAKI